MRKIINSESQITELKSNDNILFRVIEKRFENELTFPLTGISRLLFDDVEVGGKLTFRHGEIVSTLQASKISIEKGAVLTFENVHFKQIVNWKEIRINSLAKLMFKTCTFDNISVLSLLKLEGTVEFNDVVFERSFAIDTPKEYNQGDIIVTDVGFKGNVTFNISVNYFLLNYSIFERNVWFKNGAIDTFLLLGVDFRTSASINRLQIGSGTKETFRILKHELIKQNNRIDAFHYFKREMEAYREQLKENKKKWWNNSDRFILELNRLSNDFSNNWKRGVLFTLISGAMFFVLYLFVLVQKEKFIDELPSSIGYFVKFLYPAHSFDFMEDYTPCGIAYFIDFIGRIFIGYGYYQTIQAFRKFGKW